MNNLKKTSPAEVLSRVFFIEDLHELGADVVRSYNPNFVNEIIEEDEDGVEQTIYELDYPYLLFSCPMSQLAMFFKKIDEENKIKEKKKIILP